jgi:hypothetical protein
MNVLPETPSICSKERVLAFVGGQIYLHSRGRCADDVAILMIAKSPKPIKRKARNPNRKTRISGIPYTSTPPIETPCVPIEPLEIASTISIVNTRRAPPIANNKAAEASSLFTIEFPHKQNLVRLNFEPEKY